MPGRQASAGSGPLRFLTVAGLPEPAVGRAVRRWADLTPLARAVHRHGRRDVRAMTGDSAATGEGGRRGDG
ncbi:hypothetical protein ACE1SV_68990 [Streptomyces sennicomposti]